MRIKHKFFEKNNAMVDELFFRREWSDTLAYILGYLWADGSVKCDVKRKQYSVRLKCTVEDEDIIWKVRDAFKSCHKVSYDGERVGRGGSITKPSVCCCIVSKVLVEDAMGLFGILPRKSYLPDILYPDYVPDKFLCHFTRGYFDGDGGLNIQKNSVNFSIYGHFNFLLGLQDQICRVVGIKKNKIGGHESIFRFSWGAREDLFKLYRWLYPYENLIHLNSKKNSFDTLFLYRIVESDLNWVI